MNAPPNTKPDRSVSHGVHTAKVLQVLSKEIKSEAGLKSILSRADEIIRRSIDPKGSVPSIPSDGLLFGLIQSGKTSIITVSSALAADNGFHCLLVLTSDNDLLYGQTLERIRRALRGIQVFGKDDWKDPTRFRRQLKSTPLAIVCSKNGNRLKSLLEAFKRAGASNLAVLITDDEADQASLNTYTSKGGTDISTINRAISNFRDFFPKNTYLQVTATPQSLFLQHPDNRYRPTFTVLSEPGEGYVGGEAFFGPQSRLLRSVSLQEVDQFQRTNQPTPTASVPPGMRRALICFLVGATSEILLGKDEGYAFLCHVSIKRVAHDLILDLIDRFRDEVITVLDKPSTAAHGRLLQEFRAAYDDLAQTAEKLAEFEQIMKELRFYLPGAKLRVVNAESDEEIKLDAVYNIFVGGNKLGRGVTIRNLIVSYYGRNPKNPNADTVLQHARMYGYRKKTLGVTRLFLPDRLAEHFRLIHQMESALRDLVAKYPDGKFEGIFISSPLRATRRNVLDPNSIGMYIAGGSYNPRYPLRTAEARPATEALDEELKLFDAAKHYHVTDIDFLMKLLDICEIDPGEGYDVWNKKTIRSALETIKTLQGPKAYLVVKRDRALNQPRRETQGIISGGEDQLVPRDAVTLFIYRQNPVGSKQVAAWWPQLRFADGNYALAFSFER